MLKTENITQEVKNRTSYFITGCMDVESNGVPRILLGVILMSSLCAQLAKKTNENDVLSNKKNKKKKTVPVVFTKPHAQMGF